MKVLKPAFEQLSVGVVLLQWFGNLAALIFASLWLQIPDSHAWEFAFSLICATLLVFSFLWLHTHTFRLLQPHGATESLWRRLLIVLATVVIGFALWRVIGLGRDHAALFAGYWNSKLSAGMRSFFNYQHLLLWQGYFYDLLQWLIVASLLPVAVIGGTAGIQQESLRQLGNAYRRFIYWAAATFAGIIGELIVLTVLSWTPGHGTVAEIVSALLRLGAAYTIGILLWCCVLGIVVTCAKNDHPNEAVSIP